MAKDNNKAATPSETAPRILEDVSATTAPVVDKANDEAKPDETKADKFTRLAKKRMGVALDKLRIVGNLSATANYEYTEEQVAKMMAALRDEIAIIEHSFKPRDQKRDRGFEF